jgi:hypothetical protein
MPWHGVDFDGTLATNVAGGGLALGEPIQRMVERVRHWLENGEVVKIVTARATIPDGEPGGRTDVEAWCLTHLGQVLEVTNEKDFSMLELWDDRAVQVISNTGQTIWDDILSRAVIAKPQRCATCRWARVPRYQTANPGLTLVCSLAGGDDGAHGGEEYPLPPDALFAADLSEWGRLAVAPTFGCIKHEEKP